MKRILHIIILFITIPLITLCIGRQDKNPLEERIVTALEETADYISNAMIDETGMSRCDYNMTEGKWYRYEPPWHTGQAVYALCEAYRITGKSSYLDAAKKSGDWWTDLEITPVGSNAAVSSFLFRDSIVTREGELIRNRGPTTLVWQRRGGEWRVLRADADHYPLAP